MLSLSETAKIKFHGAFFSIECQRVFACLLEKEIDFDYVPVYKEAPVLSLNPFGQAPVLEDGDLKLFESRAITSYIAHVYADKGTQLMFSDPKKIATAYVWAQVEAKKFDPVASSLCKQLVFHPMFEGTTDTAGVVEKAAKLGEILDIYETRLAQSKYLGGDDFTLADLHHLPCIHFLMGTPVKNLFHSRPLVRDWCANILDRPAWHKFVAMNPSYSLRPFIYMDACF